MSFDLEKMSKKELEDLIKQATAEISRAYQRERNAAKAAAEQAAAEFGFSLNELVSAKPKLKRDEVAEAKYVNPNNPKQTWSGKGRRPDWYKEALATGKSAENMMKF